MINIDHFKINFVNHFADHFNIYLRTDLQYAFSNCSCYLYATRNVANFLLFYKAIENIIQIVTEICCVTKNYSTIYVLCEEGRKFYRFSLLFVY